MSQYSDTGQIGVYLGTREENLATALELAKEQIADVALGGLTDRELVRAKENLKGRIVISMEGTSTRMSRLGKSLITDSELLSLDRIIGEIDAVEREVVCELAGALLAPERLSAAGIGPDEGRFLEAVGRVTPALAA
jgi:predicted Zn-dependent peptidase